MKKEDLKKMISNLPKYPSVLGRDRFFNSAVLIPLVKIKGEYYLLFQKRAANIRQGGDICFPGGGFEKGIDKNFKQTALRETKEELGIDKKEIKIVGQLDTMVAPIGAIVEVFVGIIKKKALKNMVIDKNEVEKIILVPLSYLKKQEPEVYTLKSEVKPYEINELGEKEIYFPAEELGLPEVYKEPWGNKKHKVWVYKYKDEVIWGMTAVILQDFLKKY
ncbi:NUDIX hydrolase [Malaciobacter mytili]|uniref:Coenzyme A pyrophosphatase n=1 Tax=Malaciobacter mytili LMG 24559 TaxID=1032238 RepID=A0AAX2AHG4_9BACT|nr:CoA pyrophosphatase [Malaciobacter mytili]AXH15643.1 coenzyme A pyrophosphatase [Malaciobacter mytili LMG 24559]RXK16169.1 coenzyme A pyrophosphatase [Malaciobacter mytili LMG 24559]